MPLIPLYLGQALGLWGGSPIAIATQGALNSPLSMAAVRGRLTIVVSPDLVHPPGMGRVDIRRWILDEDEMLLAVIMAFLRIKDD